MGAADAFLKSENFAAADRELVQARTRLELNGRCDPSYRTAVAALAQELSGKTQAEERYLQFQELRQKIHADLYHLDDTTRRRTLELCRTGLGLYDVLDGDRWKEQPEYQLLKAERQISLQQDLAEMLFVLARLEVRGVSLTPVAKRAQWAVGPLGHIGPFPKDPDPALESAAHRRALEALSRIEKVWRPLSAIYLWMAESWKELGENKRSEEARKRATALQSTTGLDYYVRAEFEAHQKQFEQALENYSRALRCTPDHYLSLLGSGVVLVRLQRYEAAEAMLTGAIALHPHTTLAYVYRGHCGLAQGRQALAQADFQKALELDPGLAKAYCDRAEEYWTKQDWEETIANCTHAIHLDGKCADAYRRRGNAYDRIGKWDESLADLTEAIRIKPTAQLYADRVHTHLEKHNPDEALSDANQAIQINPEWAGGYSARALVYDHKRQAGNALSDMNVALRMEPDNQYYLSSRGNYLCETGRREEAIADYTAAIRRDPEWHVPYHNRGTEYLIKGEIDKAILDFNELIRVFPWGQGYALRGVAYAKKGDLDKAIADLSEAIRRSPKDARLYNSRGVYCGRKQDYDQAIADYTEAIRIDPKCPWYFSNRGRAYEKKGDLWKAIADCTKAVELKLNDPYTLNVWSWSLAMGADTRPPVADIAVLLAERAVKLSPKAAMYWNTLGVAQYRAATLLKRSLRFGRAWNWPPAVMRSTGSSSPWLTGNLETETRRNMVRQGDRVD